MSYRKFTFFTILMAAFSFVSAQDDYEADTDSAWIASQNDGSTVINESKPEDIPTPECIGDGCNANEPENSNISVQANNENQAPNEDQNSICVGDNCASANDSVKTAAVDTSKCAGADSISAYCKDEEEEEENTYDRVVTNSSAEFKARREGFSRKIKVGFRAAGGINHQFGKKSGDWGTGADINAGAFARLPIWGRTFAFSSGVDYTFRYYPYESSSDYADYEGSVKSMLFEIPFILQVFFDDEGFFFGLGFDLGLKLAGYSNFDQSVDTGKSIEKETRNNTIRPAGVEMGGLVNIGYAFSSWFEVDLRIVQDFTNLLNSKVIAESPLMGTKLYTLHTTLGFSLLL